MPLIYALLFLRERRKTKAKKMGIQYNAVRAGDSISKKPRIALARQLVAWGKIFDDLGMAPYVNGKGSAGNMGFKSDGRVFVTPSGGCLGNLDIEDIMAVINYDEITNNLYFHGSRGKNPTSEALIYWDIFNEREDISVILHGHDLLSLEKANALMKKHPGMISITPNVTEAGSKEFRKEMHDLSKSKKNYLVGKGHGFFALGKTFDEAGSMSLRMRTEAINLFLGDKIKKLNKKYSIV